MSYIMRSTKWIKVEVFECFHPDVFKVWFTGALSSSGIPAQMDLTLNLYFKNGDRKEFVAINAIQPDAEEKLIIEAEEYLQSITPKIQ